MVEALKYLNYCQLAKNSLVSKRFRNVIQTHRHKLALLFVHSIGMNELNRYLAGIKIFDKELSPYAYNGWVARNHYSKQVALEDLAAAMLEIYRKFYMLSALADYKDSNRSYGIKNVFEAYVELNRENWPMFQHFVRLLTDPYIYIRSLTLTFQVDVLNLLAKAINSDDNCVQCKELVINLRVDSQKFIKWVKDHTRCDKFRIYNYSGSNNDDEFLDLFMTGAYCTSEIYVERYDLCKVVVAFVQNFMDLKSCDENQMVESIRGTFSDRSVEVVKRNYAEVLVKEERNQVGTFDQVFEFVNNDIGKKLNLIVANRFRDRMSEFSLKIAIL
ncbi:hypothetical protein Ddc_21001 [Ditylenchus destructor]|nr:hypothetical protein Ddc_21001 [Ditylenchus destructor]